ncbi:DEAD/DEAH box helicase [Microbacterium sp. NC79]|uniref:DEAD/DEAH box helicase n=1 Tax=Microbacterium sp. NC79 TaxID=2851009 RepID=UPI001C2C95CB|nr:DEAD/DEAH box helicase [Microbacterium sp. NC79]
MTANATPSWRDRLGVAVAPARDGHTDLGLLFQLRTLTRAGSQWTSPQATPATSVRKRGTQRLGVRPALRSKSGNWVTSDITWGTLTYKIERLGLDEAQVSWFTQFAALHRASGSGYRASESDWLYLDDFASALLWPHLDSAAAAGITLLTGKKATRVDLAPAARIVAEVAPDGTSGLRIAPTVTIDDVGVTPTGVVADHGIYVCAFDPDLRVMLAPVPGPGLDLVSDDAGTIRVPGADVEEFWEQVYPALTTQIAVAGRGIELPEVREETVLVVEYRSGDTVLMRWESWVGSTHQPLAVGPVDVPEKLTGAEAAAFVAEELPVLAASGIRIHSIGDKPDYRAATEAPTLRLTAVPTNDNDWLSLGFVIMLGEYIVPFARVFAALSRGQTKLLLVDKSYLSLNQPIFDSLRELIHEGAQLEEWETGAIVSRYHAHLFEPFEDESDQRPEAVLWRSAARALTSTPEPIDAPPGIIAELRPYQLDGFRWLAHLDAHRLGGILADDMGLGKTLQTIALLEHTRGSGRPALVVAPTSVVGGWNDEIRRFAPGLSVAVVGSTKDVIPADTDVVITSYALFRLEFDRFERQRWRTLVLDEAQYIKNPASQVHECAYALNADVTFALTGTPMENSLLDLWAILRVVAPGLYPSRLRFTDRYIKAHSVERIGELRSRIRPLMLRRTKQNVALELPSRTEQVVTIDLGPEHRRLYNLHLQRERQKILGLVEDLDRNRFIVFRSLTLLRMLALDPTLIGDEGTRPGATTKLDELLDRIEDLASEGHRALVFSQFTSYLALVRARLEARGIRYEYLDGTTTNRPEVISRFREGDAPVFLVSLRAGGVGLTLTEADSVFLLDPWWNPATEAQAIDRTHRIGQTKPVMVYRLVARDTIEEKVVALGESKRALFTEVIDGGDLFAGALTADDVRGLLA